MKIAKIIFLAIFLLAAGISIYSMVGGGDISNADSTGEEENQFIKEIDLKIDSLANLPDNTFSQQFYIDIKYRITEFTKQQHFGETERENNQVSEALLKNLYSTYAPKFVKQSMSVFGRSEWKPSDLNLIRSELSTLSSSTYLESSSEISNSFSKIRSILAKYDEITAFVNSCKSFSAPIEQLDNQFPDVSDKIQRANQYLSGNLENPFVNNCSRLKEELRNTQQYLADNYYVYLMKKIDFHGSRYTEFSSTSAYQIAVTKKLRNEVAAFKEKFPLGNHRQLTNLIRVYEVKADDFMNN